MEDLKITADELKVIEAYRSPYFNYGSMVVYKREGQLSGAIEIHATVK